MKKSALVFVFLLATTFFAFNTIPDNDSIETSSAIEPKDTFVTSITKDLLELGYTSEMMTDVFGADHSNLPKSSDELEQIIFVIDNSIRNGKYTREDRPELVAMSITALYMFEESTDLILLARDK